MSYANVHTLRQNPGAESFNRAWDAAIEQATGRIAETMIDHAINGVPETVVAGGGKRIERRRFNHRIMMWLLQHHRPRQYGGDYRSPFAATATAAAAAAADDDEVEDDEEMAARLQFLLDALQTYEAGRGTERGGLIPSPSSLRESP